MKSYFIFIFLLVLNFFVFSDNTSDLTENWIKNKIISRQQSADKGNKSELRIKDSDLIYELQKKDFKNIEPLVASYLYKIIIENKKLVDVNNVQDALDVLESRFQDKTYFITYASDLTRFEIIYNPFVIKKVWQGFRKNLAGYDDKIFKGFEAVYRATGLFLFNKQEYGSDYVIPEFIAFLREYINLVTSGKIKDTQRARIISICQEMGLNSKKQSDFQRYLGGEELKQEFFYYAQEAFGK
ncbi:MAG: hypothetical protein A2086_11910 [Spirochaetes bacterium GWD1_27_9]|nr:MAG: hypothetical protein A2Z98_11835 [Spirochaetes bacterium GWB1_27_13]OHD28113.1 MAG: hypothetical protein A2Y34_05625 [Spirochaetes bacterium GWC1_27_15]OHD35501.1 MAG: hypothetical protein A2086_11910 [Spirochaetes bacterium GWD1_27_9]